MWQAWTRGLTASTYRQNAAGVVAARQLSIVDPGPNGCPAGGQGGGRQGVGQTASG